METQSASQLASKENMTTWLPITGKGKKRNGKARSISANRRGFQGIPHGTAGGNSAQEESTLLPPEQSTIDPNKETSETAAASWPVNQWSKNLRPFPSEKSGGGGGGSFAFRPQCAAPSPLPAWTDSEQEPQRSTR
jgi:hypothetical protein